jgi:hypothetical protein
MIVEIFDLTRSILNAIECGKKPIFNRLFIFMKIIFNHVQTLSHGKDCYRIMQLILDLYKPIHIDYKFIGMGNEAETTDFAHLFLKDVQLTSLMYEYNIWVIDNGIAISVFQSLYKSCQIRAARLLCNNGISLHEFLYILGKMKTMPPNGVGIILDAYKNNDLNWNFEQTNPDNDNILHLLMKMDNLFISENKSDTCELISIIIKANPSIVNSKNNDQLTPNDLGLINQNKLREYLPKEIVKHNLDCRVVDALCNLKKTRELVEIFNHCKHKNGSTADSNILKNLHFIQLDQHEKLLQISCIFILFKHPNILQKYLEIKKATNEIIKISSLKKVHEYSPLEFALLYSFPMDVVQMLLKYQNYDSIRQLADSDRITNYIVSNGLLESGVRVVQLSIIFLMVLKSDLFPQFFHRYLDQSDMKLSATIRYYDAERKLVEVTFINLVFTSNVAIKTVHIIVSALEDVKLSRSIFQAWFSKHVNSATFALPFPKLKSFTIRGSDFTYPLGEVPLPSLDKSFLHEFQMLCKILDRLRLDMFMDSISETPISFFLFHVFILINETFLFQHAEDVIQQLLQKIIYDKNVAQLVDPLGNTLYHIFAKYSPFGMYLVSLSVDYFDWGIRNNRGDSSFLIFCTSIDTNSRDIYKICTKLERLFKNRKLNPDLFFASNFTGSNPLYYAVLNDILNMTGFKNGTESVLTKNLFKMVPLLSKECKLEILRSTFKYWPCSISTTPIGKEQRIELDSSQWITLIQKYSNCGIDIDYKLIYNSIIKKKADFGELAHDVLTYLNHCTESKSVCKDPLELHYLCKKPSKHILDSTVDLIVDSNNRYPIHIYALKEKDRGPNSIKYLEFLTKHASPQILLTVDKFACSPFYYSLLADVYFGIHCDKMSRMSEFLRHDIIVEDKYQRNALFYIFNLIDAFDRDYIDEDEICLTPITIEKVMKIWMDFGRLDINEVDENGVSVIEYCNSIFEVKKAPKRLIKQIMDMLERISIDTKTNQPTSVNTDNSDVSIFPTANIFNEELSYSKKRKRNETNGISMSPIPLDKDDLNSTNIPIPENAHTQESLLDRQENLAASENTNLTISPKTSELLIAAKKGDSSSCSNLIKAGADILALNEHNQYPLHLYCISISFKVDFRGVLILNTFKEFLPFGQELCILNQIDDFGNTPLSIMFGHDVWVYGLKKGYFQKNRHPRVVKNILNEHVQLCTITREMIKLGARLRLLCTKNGNTPWHFLAQNGFSGIVIAGYGNRPMYIILFLLLVKLYQNAGLNVNQVNNEGQTGMDILVNRRLSHDLFNLCDDDFDILMVELEKFGCKCTK